MSSVDIHPDVERILFTKADIDAKVDQLAAQINEDYKDCQELVIVGILKGASIFCADLIRKIKVPVKLEFMAISSYGNSTTSSGTVRIIMDLRRDIEGKDVLVIEDIIDTGLTSRKLLDILKTRHPKSLNMASFLRKPKQTTEIEIKYTGFLLESDLFVVGYGLDYSERLRELEYVGILKPEVYKS